MTITKTAQTAVKYILSHDGERVCKELKGIAYEAEICKRHCQGLDEFCVKRVLKYYDKQQNRKS